mmetsp:Transcript_30257/g.75146  ORF Transcript_30257/g.75146 Transcript_30257/m.75146 type:complete len:231 (-) Transcript_30257:511-1203(-)
MPNAEDGQFIQWLPGSKEVVQDPMLRLGKLPPRHVGEVALPCLYGNGRGTRSEPLWVGGPRLLGRVLHCIRGQAGVFRGEPAPLLGRARVHVDEFDGRDDVGIVVQVPEHLGYAHLECLSMPLVAVAALLFVVLAVCLPRLLLALVSRCRLSILRTWLACFLRSRYLHAADLEILHALAVHTDVGQHILVRVLVHSQYRLGILLGARCVFVQISTAEEEINDLHVDGCFQ